MTRSSSDGVPQEGAVLTARGLHFRQSGVMLLEDVDLALTPGTLTVIVGPNGAGKSTLLRLFAGELVPTAGTILMEGLPLAQWPAWRLAAKRAVLPQGSTLAFPFTVDEVVRLGLDGVGRGLGRTARLAIAQDAMQAADISHLADRTIDGLSGGERQRTHLARVLAQLTAGRSLEPRQILMLDEPTAGLDIGHQMAILRLARTIASSGVAVLAILHELHLATRFADQLVIMKDGRVVGAGAVSDTTLDDLARVFDIRPSDVPVLTLARSG